MAEENLKQLITAAEKFLANFDLVTQQAIVDQVQQASADANFWQQEEAQSAIKKQKRAQANSFCGPIHGFYSYTFFGQNITICLVY